MEQVNNCLNFWQARGWIRAIDRVFVETLARRSPVQDIWIWALAALASAQLGRGHPALNVRALCQNFAASFPYEANGDDVADIVDAATLADWDLPNLFANISFAKLKKAMLRCDWFFCPPEHADASAPLVLEGDFLFLRRFFAYEVFVAERLRALRAKTFVLPKHAPELLADIFASLTVEQGAVHWQALAAALCLRSGLTVITGGPGTGKTTTVVRVLALLQQLASGNLEIALAAPTGKAALRLRESIAQEMATLPEHYRFTKNLHEKTIHKLLGKKPQRDAWTFDANRQLPIDVLVIDEASMISLEMMAAILAALPSSARLILLGDQDQLASVEAGAVLGSLCPDFTNLPPQTLAVSAEVLDFLNQFSRALHSPMLQALGVAKQASLPLFDVPADKNLNEDARADHCLRLRVSRRFPDDSDIGQLARAVNAGDVQASEAIFKHGQSVQTLVKWADLLALAQAHFQALQAHIAKRPSLDAQDDWARAALHQLADFQILAALREGDFGVAGLNKLILKTCFADVADWFAGRVVMMTKNDYALGLMNGDLGLTLPWRDAQYPEEERLRVVFLRDDAKLVWVLPTRLSTVETAFAMTVHKSQGSEFKRVALVLPPKFSPVLTRELIYTGLTRTKSYFALFAENREVWRQALRTKMQRSGALAERLR